MKLVLGFSEKNEKKKNLEMHSIRKFYYKPTSFPSKVFFVVVFVLAELGKSLLNESKTTLAWKRDIYWTPDLT